MQLLSEAFTSASGACNEDTYGFTDNSAWILDGATSLSRRTVLNASGQMISDAAYFVSLFSSSFGKNIHLGKNIAQTINSSLEWIRQDENISNYLEKIIDVPSASFSAVRLEETRLQVANLGDCSILLQMDEGHITQFGSSAVRQLDAQLLSHYLKLRKELQDRTAIWNSLVPVIRNNRSKMNKTDGYWILEPQGHGLCGLQQININFKVQLRGLLVTDGLYRIIDTYNLMSLEDFFYEAFTESGLERLIGRVRDAELLDPNAERWPRVKIKDDATIVKFETK